MVVVGCFCCCLFILEFVLCTKQLVDKEQYNDQEQQRQRQTTLGLVMSFAFAKDCVVCWECHVLPLAFVVVRCCSSCCLCGWLVGWLIVAVAVVVVCCWRWWRSCRYDVYNVVVCLCAV